MNAACIAYKPDGSICRAPATYMDIQRGGMVCEMCRRAATDRNGLAIQVGDPVQMQGNVVWAGTEAVQVRLLGKSGERFVITVANAFVEAMPRGAVRVTEARYVTPPYGNGAMCRFCGKVVEGTAECCEGVAP